MVRLLSVFLEFVRPIDVGVFFHKYGFNVIDAIAYAKVVLVRKIENFKFSSATIVGLTCKCAVCPVVIFYGCFHFEVFDENVKSLLPEQFDHALFQRRIVK